MWPSAATLAEFLLTLPAAAPSSTLTCIELGAGLGAVGMLLAQRGGARVVLTDQPQMLPLLKRNVDECFGRAVSRRGDRGPADLALTMGQWARPASHAKTGDSMDEAASSSGAASGPAVWVPEVRALAWGGGFKDRTSYLGGALPARYKLVVGSDLCYDDETFESLRTTIDAVAAPNATVVLAVHDRPAAHAFFLAPWPRWVWQLSAAVDQGFDPVSGKSTVMVYVGRETAAMSAATDGPTVDGGAFALGEVVEAHSLTSATTLNSKRGVVVQTALGGTELAGRVGVSFAPPLGRKAVKASNLRRVGGGGNGTTVHVVSPEITCRRCEEPFDPATNTNESCVFMKENHRGSFRVNWYHDTWHNWCAGFGPPNSSHCKQEYGNEGCYYWTGCGCTTHGSGECEREGWHRAADDPDTTDDEEDGTDMGSRESEGPPDSDFESDSSDSEEYDSEAASDEARAQGDGHSVGS